MQLQVPKKLEDKSRSVSFTWRESKVKKLREVAESQGYRHYTEFIKDILEGVIR